MATRKQITDAARVLFAERGYVATTITTIAEAADIPAPTIYSALGTKSAILAEIAARAVAVLDVEGSHREALAEEDPAKGLRRAMRLHRQQFDVMFDVIAIYQEAARTDPDTAEALRTILANRERVVRRHIEAIADQLAPGLSVSEGVDIYLTLVLPEVYRTLVRERGWSPEKYEEWVGDNLIHQLLDTAER